MKQPEIFRKLNKDNVEIEKNLYIDYIKKYGDFDVYIRECGVMDDQPIISVSIEIMNKTFTAKKFIWADNIEDVKDKLCWKLYNKIVGYYFNNGDANLIEPILEGIWYNASKNNGVKHNNTEKIYYNLYGLPYDAQLDFIDESSDNLIKLLSIIGENYDKYKWDIRKVDNIEGEK